MALLWKRQGRSSKWLGEAEAGTCWAYVERDWRAGRWDWFTAGMPRSSGVKYVHGDAPNIKAARKAAELASELFFATTRNISLQGL